MKPKDWMPARKDIPRFKTEQAEYHLKPDVFGEIVASIAFELYETEEIAKTMGSGRYVPKSKLLGSGRKLLIETEAGVSYLRGDDKFGRSNHGRFILGELSLTEKDGLVFKMNECSDLNLDPQGIINIVANPAYQL
jgi:hypothetical protein